jgi:hypothetical protein
MAVCPQCGSSDVTLKRDISVNWGRALIGWAAFGVVGGAVAGVTGDDRNSNVCLDCGASWRAEDVHKIIQIVKEATGKKLDLSRESHRNYCSVFIDRVSPYFAELSTAEASATKIVADAKSNTVFSPSAEKGVYIGIAIMVSTWLLLMAIKPPSLIAWMFLLASFASPIVGQYYFLEKDKKKGWSHEKAVRLAEQSAEEIKANAREDLLRKIRLFTKEYPLDS